MRRVWVAVICVLLLVAAAAWSVFYATVGRNILSDRLSDWAERRASPLLYRAALAVNPYDTDSRLWLAEHWRKTGDLPRAEALLREGAAEYALGPELFLALAVMQVEDGRLDDACATLDSVPEGWLSRRVALLRPENAEAPPSGRYAAGRTFPLEGGGGMAWYRLNAGLWTLYGAPLELQEGRHRLEVLTLDEHCVPSPVAEYWYTVEQPLRTAGTGSTGS